MILDEGTSRQVKKALFGDISDSAPVYLLRIAISSYGVFTEAEIDAWAKMTDQNLRRATAGRRAPMPATRKKQRPTKRERDHRRAREWTEANLTEALQPFDFMKLFGLRGDE